MAHATRLSLGAAPNNVTPRATTSHVAGTWAAVAPSISTTAAPTAPVRRPWVSPVAAPAASRISALAAEGEDEVARRPPQSADRRRQELLGVQRGLLGAEPQRRLHAVQGDDHPVDPRQRGEEGVDESARPAHPFEDLLRLRAVAEQIGDAVGDRSEHRAARHHGDEPSEECAALQARCQSHRAGEGAGGPLGPGRWGSSPAPRSRRGSST